MRDESADDNEIDGTPFSRKAYQLRFKLRVIDYIDLAIARNPHLDLALEKKELAARNQAASQFNVVLTNVRRWYDERVELRNRAASDASAAKLIDDHKPQFPLAESHLGEWMRVERNLEHILGRAAITAKFRSLVALHHSAAASADFKYSNAWFENCMRRLGFSWRAITRKASATAADQMPTMTTFVSKLSRRMGRAAKKQALAIDKEVVLLNAANDVFAAQQLAAPRAIARDPHNAQLVKGALHLRTSVTATYRLFNDQIEQRDAARGLLAHQFGIGPWARFNVDQVPLHFGIHSTHTYAEKGVASVPGTGMHNEHKESRDATLQICSTAAASPHCSRV